MIIFLLKTNSSYWRFHRIIDWIACLQVLRVFSFQDTWSWNWEIGSVVIVRPTFFLKIDSVQKIAHLTGWSLVCRLTVFSEFILFIIAHLLKIGPLVVIRAFWPWNLFFHYIIVLLMVINLDSFQLLALLFDQLIIENIWNRIFITAVLHQNDIFLVFALFSW